MSLSGDLTAVASVEYLAGNYRIANVTQKPFSFDWNSALAADGNLQIESIARDSFGAVLSDVTVPLVLQNYGNTAEVTSGLASVLSGTVPLVLHGVDTRHYPAFWQISIDGELLAPRYTDQNAQNDVTITQNLDTTAYPNGIHEFQFVFHSNDYKNPNPPSGSTDFRGMVLQNVDIENGRSFMEVAGAYLHVYAPVSTGTVALGCYRLYTNGDRDTCQAPQYTPADPTIATVDSTGNLTALKEGYTDVTLAEGGKSTQIHVWVKNDAGLPHFTANGAFSTTYTPGQSAFIVAPFQLSPGYVSADANLMSEVRRAGINTLTRGIYLNPVDLTTTYPMWKQSYDNVVVPEFQFTAANGFRLIGAGDDIARNIGTEAFRTLNWPPARQAVQYAMQQFTQSGAAVASEVIDEGAFLWGPNPTPPGKLGAPNSMQSIVCVPEKCTVTWPNLADNTWRDAINNGLTFTLTGNQALNTPAGSVYTVANVTANTFDFLPAAPLTGSFTIDNAPSTEFQWFARAGTCSGAPCRPPVLNSALSTIVSWIKGAPAFPALSFPAGGIVSPVNQRNWIGQGSLSDYASHFWDTNQLRVTYVFGKGIRESTYYMLSSFYARQPYMQLNRPQMMLIGTSGNAFLKNSPAGTPRYNPPVDQLINAGNVPKAVASTMFAAAAAGVSALRPYQFEPKDTYQQQVNAGPGGGYQSGAAPNYGEVALWRAMGYGANLLTKVLQPYLLGTQISSPSLGRNFITGARKSSAGKMLIVVNGWDGSRQVNVDFTPFDAGFGCVRYRVNDTYIKNAILPSATGESLQMASGETAIYVFPNAADSTGLDLVNFLPTAGSSRVAVTYGYVYDQNVAAFGEPVECSQGCTIPVDRRIPNIYFRYSFANPVTGAIVESPVRQLGGANVVHLQAIFPSGRERSAP